MSTNIFTAIGQFMDNVINIAAQQTATVVAPLPTTQRVTTVPSSASATADGVCQLCRKDDKPDTLLICDGCETMLHTRCLNLPAVPPGDWFCPRCVSEGKKATDQTPTENDVVVVYERVSSKGQDAPEYGREGLKTQRHTIMEFCMKRGIRIRHTFTDVGSARNLLREESKLKRGESRCTLVEYGQMLSYAHKCKDPIVILVYSVSRFGRNLEQVTEFLHELHEMGCYVFSVSDNVSSGDSRFMTLVAQSQAQSDDLSRVMRASIERRRQQGHFIGPAPFGYEAYVDANNIRRIRPVAPVALAIINNMKLSTVDVVQQLNAGGVAFADGDYLWTLERVKRIRARLGKLGLTTKAGRSQRRVERTNVARRVERLDKLGLTKEGCMQHYRATSSKDPVSEALQERIQELAQTRSPKTPSPIDQSATSRQLQFEDDEEKDLRCQQEFGIGHICSKPVVDKAMMLCHDCKLIKMHDDANKVNDDED